MHDIFVKIEKINSFQVQQNFSSSTFFSLLPPNHLHKAIQTAVRYAPLQPEIAMRVVHSLKVDKTDCSSLGKKRIKIQERREKNCHWY